MKKKNEKNYQETEEMIKHDDETYQDKELYPDIEWTDEMIKDDMGLDDPDIEKTIEAMERTQESLDEAPLELKFPTIH